MTVGVRRFVCVGFVCWMGGVGLGCGDGAEPPLPSARPSARAPDAVDPSGLIEGPQTAFGLKLPLRSHIARSSSNSITVELPFTLESVSTYLRSRLTSKLVDVGPRSTVFQEASVTGSDDQRGLLNVTVARRGVATVITFLKRAPPRAPYTPSPPPSGSVQPSARPDAGVAEEEPEPGPDPDPVSPGPVPGGADLPEDQLR